jgi:prolyl 4-hydroxylase
VLVARFLRANGKVPEAMKHYESACELDPSGWAPRLEVAEALIEADPYSGAGLPAQLAGHALRCCREACELAVRERERFGRRDNLRGARCLAAELRARGMLGRLLRGARHDPEGAAAAMGAASALAERYCNPAMATLPRLGVTGPHAKLFKERAASGAGGPAAVSAKLSLLGRSVRVQRLSRFPLLYRVSGLLSAEECRHVVRSATPSLESSGTPMQGGGQAQNFRTSSTAWVPTAEDALLRTLSERVAALMGLPPSGLLAGKASDSGKMQVVQYGRGQQYGVHHDCNGLIRRYATCLYYLGDVNGGGETLFPAASDDEAEWAFLPNVDAAISYFLAPEHKHVGARLDPGLERQVAAAAEAAGSLRGGSMPTGVSVTPKMGDAVLWYNYDADGKLDPRAVHCAKPVTSGQKWAANHWVSLTPEELLTEVRPPSF